METIQINRKNAVYGYDELNVKAMIELDDRLLILLNDDILNKIMVGGTLRFNREVFADNDEMFSLGEEVTVVEKGKYKYQGKTYPAVYTTIPLDRKLKPAVNYNTHLNFVENSGQCRTDYDCYFDNTHHYLVVYAGGTFHVEDWLYYYGGDEPFFIIEFNLCEEE